MSELNRLAFIRARDGDAGALDFACKTYQIYRQALRSRSTYAREFRRPLVQSCLQLRAFLRANYNPTGD